MFSSYSLIERVVLVVGDAMTLLGELPRSYRVVCLPIGKIQFNVTLVLHIFEKISVLTCIFLYFIMNQ